MNITSVTPPAAIQAAEKTTDKALANATSKLSSDRREKASDATLRADQRAVSTATKSAAAVDAQLAKASSSSSPAPSAPVPSAPVPGAKPSGKVDVKA